MTVLLRSPNLRKFPLRAATSRRCSLQVNRQSFCLMAAAVHPASNDKVRIDIVSDTICPWCYVGKRRLESAMKQFQGKKEFEVHWHPFQLNPDGPKEGVEKLTMLKEKFGASRAEQMVPMMEKTFADVGLHYNIKGKTGNTFNSHRVIHWAGKEGGPAKQDEVVEKLFRSYFIEEGFINDKEVLLEAAQMVDPAKAKEVVEDESKFREEVDRELREMTRGVHGVPHFIFNGKLALSGAQDPATFVEVFRKL